MYLQPRTFRNETVDPSYLSNRGGNQEHVYLIIVFAVNAFAVIIQFIYRVQAEHILASIL